ncbi:hypothetical protein EJ05DRAFT_388826 [Pseudovirgaria hyperparasitica]|uniref:Zn(2)-C6 fungal-type domain-containing protein n=1 Tax=Pseudovirgaria hyperparasitica TaxID=470096 RepID=A0A6A6W385_9PEZI|nr:uncharacterized protein EJ05DRAFT_388826 [Pseudovirgaria hyperparasitica]KAF2757408.1 hypothetical protein EJ05DRAFT_388826 [Pseudovirgaria hyperparasitica]
MSPGLSETGTSNGSSMNGINKTGIKRARPQLSCMPCRQGKLKCNRLQPFCDQCLKRSKEDSCVYPPPPQKIKQAQNMKGRIRHLENLVVDLMNAKQAEDGIESGNGNVSSSSHGTRGSPGDSSGSEEYHRSTLSAFGKLKVSAEKTSYVSGSHWSAILDEIKEVRTFFEDEEDVPEDMPYDADPRTNGGGQISFGTAKIYTKEQLIDMIPPKDEADRLVALWFNSSDPFLYALHAPTFQKEYLQFWVSPERAPVMWLGLLFSIMSVSVLLIHRGEIWERKAESLANHRAAFFQEAASSAMNLADIARGHPYTLECLALYGESQFLRSDEAHLQMWLMAGVLVRIALKMGYHRDASHYNISPFRAEMRRRVWLVIYQMDVLVSFAVGLPSMVRSVFSDTKLPTNLYDSDLTIDMTELPPARPRAELTPGSYGIAKCRLCQVFAAAFDASHYIETPAWSKTMEMDREVDAAIDDLPPPLQVKALNESLSIAPGVLMCRYNLRLLYLKTKIVLHRRFLTESNDETGSQAAISRKVCLDSAMEILRHQRTLWAACQKGGQLYDVRWYLSSLTTYDFLLAAMIISLELNRWCNTSLEMERSVEAQAQERNGICQELVQALELLNVMLRSPGYRSRNARRASNFLRVMLARVKRSGLAPLVELPPSIHSAEATVYPTTPDLLADVTIPATEVDDDDRNAYSSITGVLDAGDNIDWMAWDRQMNQDTAAPTDPSWLSSLDMDDLLSYEYNEEGSSTWIPWSGTS